MTKVEPPAWMLPEMTAPAPAVKDQSRPRRRVTDAATLRWSNGAVTSPKRSSDDSQPNAAATRQTGPGAPAVPDGPAASSASHKLLAMTVGPTGAETPQPNASSGMASASAAAPRSAAVRAGTMRMPT
jgi:hypothetical protein